jgi:hypothetical protein
VTIFKTSFEVYEWKTEEWEGDRVEQVLAPPEKLNAIRSSEQEEQESKKEGERKRKEEMR